MKLRLAAILLSLLVGITSGTSQVLLIGGSTGNGNFESGSLTPWGSGDDVRILNDSAFASEGAGYASFQSSLVRPVVAGQNLLANTNDGLLFNLSFDARAGSSSLDVVSVQMTARTPNGAPLSASVVAILAPALTSSLWQTYQYQLQMPTGWNDRGVFFYIAFNKDQPLDGISHFAYLDNLVLTQVPEPSSMALIGGGAVLAAIVGRVRRRRQI